MRRRLFASAGILALGAALAIAVTAFTPRSHASPSFHLLWSSANTTTGFAAVPVAVGGFSDCNHNPDTTTAVCLGLPVSLQKIWWAYPAGWPDTATGRGLPVHGYYQPQDTVWI